jgi:glycine betaine/choline ABC-type transport system substrate-binding protein
MILIPAILDTFASLKDKTIKIVFYANELTPEQLVEVAKHSQQFGYLAFKNDKFKQEQLNTLKDLKAEYSDKTKSPSKRLRNVLYVTFEQNNNGFKTFEEFYNFKMNEITEHYKSKLI